VEHIRDVVAVKNFEFECGLVIPSIRVKYSIYGSKNVRKSLIVGTGLTCSDEVHKWWPLFLNEYCKVNNSQNIICFNPLAAKDNLELEKYYKDKNFFITIKDQAKIIIECIKHLKINNELSYLGCSFGGQVGIGLLSLGPNYFKKFILAAASEVSDYVKLSHFLQYRLLEENPNNLKFARHLMRLECRSPKMSYDDLVSINLEMSSESEKFENKMGLEGYIIRTKSMTFFDLNKYNFNRLVDKKIHLISIENDIYTPREKIEELYLLLKDSRNEISLNNFSTMNGHEAWITDGLSFYNIVKEFL
tara:strand:- start:2047 stop:2958 length:912 start_codon:yes stop_codon:yes gene_type:complete